MRHLFQHEVKYYFKNFHEVIYLYCYFALLILIIPMGLEKESHLLHELAPTIFWIAILTSVALGAIPMFQRDADSGVLELYPQLPGSLYSVPLAKWLAFYLVLLPPMLASIPVFLAFHGLPLEIWPRFAIAMAAGTAAFSILSCLASILTVGLERARAVSMLIVMPLATPIIIFGSDYLRQAGSLWSPSLAFILAFSIFLLPLFCLAGASCIRNAQ